MGTHEVKEISRRQALRRGAVAGAVVWTAPMIISSTAHATNGGSSGAGIDGPVSSVTCRWNQRFWQPNQGTTRTPGNQYANLGLIEIDGGEGWKTCGFGDTFTVLSGYVLKFRPYMGATGGSTTGADEPAQTEPTIPADSTTESNTETPATPAPATPEAPALPTPEAPVVDNGDTTTGSVTDESVAPTILAPLPIPSQTTSVEETFTETIVIDMSGRTDLNIGDVYGIFQIVAAEPV